MPKLRALKEFDFQGRKNVGAEFDAGSKDARMLVDSGHCELADAPPAKPSKKKAEAEA